MIDAHLHLADPRFDPDRATVIKAARDKGVSGFLSASTAPDEWAKNLSFQTDGVFVFIGTHPKRADRHDQALLRRLLQENPQTGIGEIGLDPAGTAEQERVFEQQFALAAELGRPVVVHCVRRFDRLAPFFKTLRKFPPAVLLHGFSGTAADVAFFKRYPCFFSFSGRIKHPDAARAVPANRIVCETDSPDQKPETALCADPDEKRNVPANLPLICGALAAITGTGAEQMTENTKAFIHAR